MVALTAMLSAAQLALIKDLVGYDGANFFRRCHSSHV